MVIRPCRCRLRDIVARQPKTQRPGKRDHVDRQDTADHTSLFAGANHKRLCLLVPAESVPQNAPDVRVVRLCQRVFETDIRKARMQNDTRW